MRMTANPAIDAGPNAASPHRIESLQGHLSQKMPKINRDMDFLA